MFVPRKANTYALQGWWWPTSVRACSSASTSSTPRRHQQLDDETWESWKWEAKYHEISSRISWTYWTLSFLELLWVTRVLMLRYLHVYLIFANIIFQALHNRMFLPKMTVSGWCFNSKFSWLLMNLETSSGVQSVKHCLVNSFTSWFSIFLVRTNTVLEWRHRKRDSRQTVFCSACRYYFVRYLSIMLLHAESGC